MQNRIMDPCWYNCDPSNKNTLPVKIMKQTLLLVTGALCLLSSHMLKAQCCSTGSPVGASVYVGVLGKNYLRAIGYYRHSFSDTYYEGDHIAKNQEPVYNSSFNFSGVTLGYGITKRLTVEIDAGYYFDKTQNKFKYSSNGTRVEYKLQGSGMSNGNLTVKYGAYINPVQQVEITTGLGFRFPFSTTPQYFNGVILDRDVQPSTNAFGTSGILFLSKGFQSISMRVFTINRYDYNFADNLKYKYGNILLNSVFVSKKIFKYFFGIVQFRNEWKTNDRDLNNLDVRNGKITDTGFDLVTIAPQLSYSIAGKWNLMAVFDIPVYKYYNGRQMTPSYSVAVSLTRDFNLARKPPVMQPEKIN